MPCTSRRFTAGRGQPGPYNGRSSAPPFFFYFSTNARRCQPGGHKFSILSHVFRPGGNTIAEKRRCHAKLCLRHAAVLRRGRPRGPAGLHAERVLLVTDSYFAENGTAARYAAAFPGAQVEQFSDVAPDPPLSLVAEGVAACRPCGRTPFWPSAAAPPSTAPRASPRSAACPSALWPCRRRPAAAPGVVVRHPDAGRRQAPLVDPALRPELAILDPALLEALPPAPDRGIRHGRRVPLRGGSGRARGQPVTDALAHSACRTTPCGCCRALVRRRDGRARRRPSGGLHGGAGLDNAGLGACHALAHALGGRFPLAHGRLCAMLLPHVIAHPRGRGTPPYAALAAACACPACAA